jgi:2,4-dienoyl-CoA reductase (NADPH2)
VVLCEKEDHLGGQLVPAAVAPHRAGWTELLEFLTREMSRLGIDVRLNTAATADLARKMDADVAVVAIGASPMHPKIPGIDRTNVVTAVDVLDDRAQVKGNVIIAGGGCSGAQTAEFLAVNGHEVTIVEMLKEIAQDAAPSDRELLLERLKGLGVGMLREARITSIEEGKLTVESPAGTKDLPADTIVLCLGMVSNDDLAGQLLKVVPQVVTVGDAAQPRKVTEAMAEGALAVISL